MPPLLLSTLVGLGQALAAGLLIGLQRGWTARTAPTGTRVAGWRTHGLLGLAGGVAGLLPVTLAIAMAVATAALLAIGYWRRSADANGRSATGAIVAQLTFGLGYLATTGHATEAVAAAAVITALLSAREPLHGLLKGMTGAEMRAAARFAIIALVILPLLPDRPMGPLDAWNPHKLWLVVVLVSGLSFAAYVASRRSNPHQGTLLTALLGSLVSSTAVTTACARRMATEPDARDALSSAILLAGAVMYARVIALTALLVTPVAPWIAAILASALALLLLPILRTARFGASGSAPIESNAGNPLDLHVALGLAALVAVMMLASKWALMEFGNLGFSTVLLLTGLADVDAAIMTLSGVPAATIAPTLAAAILSGPVIANTLLKAGITLALAGSEGRSAAVWLAASGLAAGASALFLTYVVASV
jgi:uncharacterized membrane protein (DUF4010 family)